MAALAADLGVLRTFSTTGRLATPSVGLVVDRPSQKYFNACSTGKVAAVGAFLDSRVSPDARDGYGLTGLIWAGRKGRIEVANLLLARGAAIDAVDRTGRTALYHAVTFRRYDFVRHLASLGAKVSPVDMHAWTPLDFAEVSGDTKMVTTLVELGAVSTRARIASLFEARVRPGRRTTR